MRVARVRRVLGKLLVFSFSFDRWRRADRVRDRDGAVWVLLADELPSVSVNVFKVCARQRGNRSSPRHIQQFLADLSAVATIACDVVAAIHDPPSTGAAAASNPAELM